jgi:hypothetical protein
MTRWIVKHKWRMSMQVSPECTLATTFKADGKFFMQILRWTRNTWRSDCKSLVVERDVWYRYPVQVCSCPVRFQRGAVLSVRWVCENPLREQPAVQPWAGLVHMGRLAHCRPSSAHACAVHCRCVHFYFSKRMRENAIGTGLRTAAVDCRLAHWRWRIPLADCSAALALLQQHARKMRRCQLRACMQAVLMVDRMISPFTLMLGPVLFAVSLIIVRTINSWDEVVTACCIYILWVLVSRTLRILPHIYRCPGVLHNASTAAALCSTTLHSSRTACPGSLFCLATLQRAVASSLFLPLPAVTACC